MKMMNVTEIAGLLRTLGCPAEKCDVMAAQLDKRARMDAERKGISHASSLKYLIGLMAQGWAAAKATPSPTSGRK